MECDVIHALRFFSVAHMKDAAFDNPQQIGHDVNQEKYWRTLFWMISWRAARIVVANGGDELTKWTTRECV